MENEYDEPDEFYGVPLEQFNSMHLLSQLDEDEICYLRSLIMCKVYDIADDNLKSFDQANSILAGFRGTSRQSQQSAPK